MEFKFKYTVEITEAGQIAMQVIFVILDFFTSETSQAEKESQKVLQLKVKFQINLLCIVNPQHI